MKNILEAKVESLLDKHFPHSYLKNIPVFRPDKAILPEGMANEIDFLLHHQEGDTHTLTIIECKECKIKGKKKEKLTHDKEWFAMYEKPKAIKGQIKAQFAALINNIDPIEEKERLKRHGFVISNKISEKLHLHHDLIGAPVFDLMAYEMFEIRVKAWAKAGPLPFRVEQSEILRRIRCAHAVPNLGHPEIRNAINYATRCRKFIDSELFRHFKPKKSHWAINGSAGMGKSVLLAYALQVFITNMEIVSRIYHERDLNSFEEKAAEIGLPRIEDRQIWVVAQTEKQKDSLMVMHQAFCREYGRINPFSHFQKVSPRILLWSEIDEIKLCNVLMVDESHDLSSAAQDKIRKWHESKTNNYLVVACDRHQKLRLINTSAKIVEGMSFRNHTSKLNRNYRNSFPAYSGSFGLMFRWFSDSGKKVLPSKTELIEGMGFQEIEMPNQTDDNLVIKSRNDAHPANIWQNLVSCIPTPRVAFTQLIENGLKQDEVLWVRFSEERTDFNYESLTVFTYHNLHARDTSAIIDKYVKGQEFPVVVIEGLPEFFEESSKASEHKMWMARRHLYMVASRANVFLFFVSSGTESKTAKKEIENLACALAVQNVSASPSGREWVLKLNFGKEVKSVPMGEYLKAIEGEQYEFEEEPIKSSSLDECEAEVSMASHAVSQNSPERGRAKNKKPKSNTQKQVLTVLKPFGLNRLPKSNPQKDKVEKFFTNPKMSIQSSDGAYLHQLKTAFETYNLALNETIETNGKLRQSFIHRVGLPNLGIKQVSEAHEVLHAYLGSLVKKGPVSHLRRVRMATPISREHLMRELSITRVQLEKTMSELKINNSSLNVDINDARNVALEYGVKLEIIHRAKS